MDITSTPSCSLDGVTTIELQEADYLPQVSQRLQRERATMHMKGFRPGQIPISVMKKRYGDKLLFEVSVKLAYQKLYDQLENKDLIDKPIIVDSTFENEANMDLDHPGVLAFTFIYGIKPAIDLEKLEQIQVNHYQVTEITEDHMEEFMHRVRLQYGTQTEVPVAEKEDMLKVSINHAKGAPKEMHLPATGMQLGDEELSFVGFKPGDTFTLDFCTGKSLQLPTNNYYYDEAMTYFYGCQEPYDLKVQQILHVTLADISDILAQDKEALPHEEAPTLETLKTLIRNSYLKETQRQADSILREDIKTQAMQHVTFDLPYNFIQQKLEQEAQLRNEDAKDYDKTVNYLRWHLLREEICHVNNAFPTPRDIARLIFALDTAYNQEASYDEEKDIAPLAKQIEHSLQSQKPDPLYTHLYNLLCDAFATKTIQKQATIHAKPITVEELDAYVLEKRSK